MMLIRKAISRDPASIDVDVDVGTDTDAGIDFGIDTVDSLLLNTCKFLSPLSIFSKSKKLYFI